MIEHPLILNILFQQRDRFVPRHFHLILILPETDWNVILSCSHKKVQRLNS
jgi:hypothetical protein